MGQAEHWCYCLTRSKMVTIKAISRTYQLRGNAANDQARAFHQEQREGIESPHDDQLHQRVRRNIYLTPRSWPGGYILRVQSDWCQLCKTRLGVSGVMFSSGTHIERTTSMASDTPRGTGGCEGDDGITEDVDVMLEVLLLLRAQR